MAGSAARLRALLAVLTLASGCGGATAPSTPATTNPAATPQPPVGGTIALVSATPAPGTELVIDTAHAGQTQFSATFAVTPDSGIASAEVELQLRDGGGQSCGSGTSGAQTVTAQKATTFTVAVTAISCAPSNAVEQLKATLVSAGSSTRTEYVTGTIAAHYALRAKEAAATVSGTVTEPGHGAVAGARVEVQDGPNTGKGATTDATGRYVLTGLSTGTFVLQAGKEGFENRYVTVTLGSASVTQDLSIARSAQPGPGAITFLGSTPSPGGEVVLTETAGGVYLRDLTLQLGVRFGSALPDAKLEVELFDDAGRQCAFSFTDRAIAADQMVAVAIDTAWVWQMPNCGAFPVGTARVKATLLTLRGPEVDGRLQRVDYATETFPIRYTIRRYPLPPDAPAGPPAISELTWKVMLPVGGDPPIAGDPVSIACTARENDGAPLTLTITLTWDGLAPAAYTTAFPSGASSSPSGARLAIGVTAPGTTGAPHARVECAATNPRGEIARKTTDIGTPK